MNVFWNFPQKQATDELPTEAIHGWVLDGFILV